MSPGKARSERQLRNSCAEFPGSADAVLLCMAHTVATAPYLGASEEAVRGQLAALLQELVAGR